MAKENNKMLIVLIVIVICVKTILIFQILMTVKIIICLMMIYHQLINDTSNFSSDFRDNQDENDGNQDDGSNQSQRKKRRVEQNQPCAQTLYDWKDNATARSPFSFTGNSGLQKRIMHDDQSKNTLPIEIFNQFFDDSIIEMMITETNRYAQQILSSRQIRRSSRMNRWKDITKENMETFLGIILVTGLIKYPKMEEY